MPISYETCGSPKASEGEEDEEGMAGTNTPAVHPVCSQCRSPLSYAAEFKEDEQVFIWSIIRCVPESHAQNGLFQYLDKGFVALEGAINAGSRMSMDAECANNGMAAEFADKAYYAAAFVDFEPHVEMTEAGLKTALKRLCPHDDMVDPFVR